MKKHYQVVVTFKHKMTVEVEAAHFLAAEAKALKAANKRLKEVMLAGNFKVEMITERWTHVHDI